MMLRAPSSLLGYNNLLSEPQMGTGLSSGVLNFAKSMHKFSRSASIKARSSLGGDDQPIAGDLSAPCRRALSESNLMPPLIRNEKPNHMVGKWHWSRIMCSKKNGLLVAADARVEGKKMVLDEEGVNSLNLEHQVQSERDPILYTEGSLSLKGEKDLEQATPMKSDFVDRVEDESSAVSGGMSENVTVAENYFSANGMDLVCTERGCRPVHVYANEHVSEKGFGIGEIGDGIASSGGVRGSSGSDSSRRDSYYQEMLKANPGNPLLLSNYAKFLHQGHHDMEKAEEYYGRAVLAGPGDGEILSHYAKFIWESHRDASRAEVYFDRAVEAAPQDCYVLASYAHFLWNSEKEEEDDDLPVDHNMTSPTYFGFGTAAAP